MLNSQCSMLIREEAESLGCSRMTIERWELSIGQILPTRALGRRA
jgi:hypothetical protein